MGILVTQGLNELKLLDARINRKINDSTFVASAKKSSLNVNGKVTKERFIENAKADHSSIVDLIKRRNAIKSAIVKSNAVTTVRVGDYTMTVAEAIERKESISYEQTLLRQLQMQYTSAVNLVNKENVKVDEAVTQLLITAYGKESKDKVAPEMQEAITKPYRESNEHELVVAFDVEKLITNMKDDIETFLSEVDTVLQVSNSTTVIEV